MAPRARTALLIIAVVVAVMNVAYLTNPAIAPGLTNGYERTTLIIVDDETGKVLATANACVVDTHAKRFTGLSDTGSLAEDEGMWFVHSSSGTYAYVMCDMDFPLGIVFVVENSTITRIHHTELNPEGIGESSLTRYRGTGKYTLKLPYGYTNETGIDAGDRAEVE